MESMKGKRARKKSDVERNARGNKQTPQPVFFSIK